MTAFLATFAWGRAWPSSSRIEGEAFGGAKGEPEDAEMRRAMRVIQVCVVGEAVIYFLFPRRRPRTISASERLPFLRVL